MSRYFKLPNGVVFDADRIQLIVRQELNDYIMVLENCPANPKLNGDDVDLLVKHLDITVLEYPTKIAH